MLKPTQSLQLKLLYRSSVRLRGTRTFTAGSCSPWSNSGAGDPKRIEGRDGDGVEGNTSGGYGAEDRDFFLSILKSSSTKREAKSYIQRYNIPTQKPVQDGNGTSTTTIVSETSSTVTTPTESTPLSSAILSQPPNNGTVLPLFGPVDHKSRTGAYIKRLLSRQQMITPTDFNVFPPTADFFTPEITEDQVHIALVKIRQVQDIPDTTLKRIGKTLVKLKKLGLIPAVVIDQSSVESPPEEGMVGRRQVLQEQAERVVRAIERGKGQARAVDGACSVKWNKKPQGQDEEEVSISLPNLLIAPLSRGIVPVISPLAYDGNQVSVAVNADSIILALTRLFSNMEQPQALDKPVQVASEPSLLSVDKIIYIDPLGGIPSNDRPNGSAHVFLNLEQEYESVRQDLLLPLKSCSTSAGGETSPPTIPSSKLSEKGKVPVPSGKPDSPYFHPERNVHLQNLTTLRIALALLPPQSSAMVTTPEVAAIDSSSSPSPWNSASLLPAAPTSSLFSSSLFSSSLFGSSPSSLSAALPSSPTSATSPLPQSPKSPPGRNPLIHNLLTDKPVFSSSLPISSPTSPYTTATTLLKHGTPLSILTNPAYPSPGYKLFKLDDGTIDLDRLVYLIEDSFGRKLDVEHYLSRVNENIAGLIIAGEYEGAAIVTWETDGLPTRLPGLSSSTSTPTPCHRVPYLDKFAVLRKSQGSGGVADVVFKAMVIGVFNQLPHHENEGIVWRSRQENVVNKWYFERAKGTWKVPGTGWTMFWTGGVWGGPKAGGEASVAGGGVGRGGEVGGAVRVKGPGEHMKRFEQYVEICRNIQPSFRR